MSVTVTITPAERLAGAALAEAEAARRKGETRAGQLMAASDAVRSAMYGGDAEAAFNAARRWALRAVDGTDCLLRVHQDARRALRQRVARWPSNARGSSAPANAAGATWIAASAPAIACCTHERRTRARERGDAPPALMSTGGAGGASRAK